MALRQQCHGKGRHTEFLNFCPRFVDSDSIASILTTSFTRAKKMMRNLVCLAIVTSSSASINSYTVTAGETRHSTNAKRRPGCCWHRHKARTALPTILRVKAYLPSILALLVGSSVCTPRPAGTPPKLSVLLR